MEAIVPISVRGSGPAEIEISAIVDTAFSESLTLPAALIDTLEMEPGLVRPVRLADGTLIDVMTYAAHVRIDDAWIPIEVEESEGDILLGMRLLRGSVLNIEVEVGGEVSIIPFS